MKKVTQHSIFILVFLFTFPLLFAQQDSTTVQKYFAPSEIPVHIESASSFLVKEKNGVLGASMVVTASKMLDDFEINFSKLKELSDSSNLNNYNSVQLKNINRQWEILQKEMSQSLSSISDRTKILEKEKEYIQNMLATWQLTREKDTGNAIPKELLNSIFALEKEINGVLEILQKELNELLRIQSGFSNRNILIETKLIELKDLIVSKQRAAFERNSYPLWNFFSDNSDTVHISIQAHNLINTYNASLKSFYDYYENKFAIGFFLFMLLLGFSFALRFYSNRIEDDSPTVKKALLIVQRPFALTFLLFLFVISLVTNTATTFNGFRKILLLIPLLLILLKIIEPKLKSGLILFMFLFLLKELKVNTGSATLIERLFLLGLTLATLLALYWISRTKLFKGVKWNRKILLLVNAFFKFGVVISILVLLLNIFGYVKLSNILINGFYNTIYVTILLFSAKSIFNALVLLLLKTKPAQKLKIVSLHSPSILSIVKKVLDLVLGIFWLIVLLQSFLVYDVVYYLIHSMLTANIGYGSISISLGEIIVFFFTIWISFQISKLLQFILEVDIFPQFKLPRGVPGAILSLSKYTIITLGLFVAFLSIGVDFNKFAILIGALGVGIGFGLQNLVNNFISGIVLIFERPIQNGDVIKIGEITGTVKKIGIRASVVRTFDGAEIIVPNGNLISTELTNWTLSDHFRRMDVVVGVEYGSNVELVRELLLEATKDIEDVLTRPAPIVLFNDFGNSSLDFILRCWTRNYDNWLLIESELRFKINSLFEENNITIPFPQTDVHIKELNSGKVEKNEKS